MKISRTAFVILFLIIAFAFVFGTVLVLNQPPLSFLGSESQGTWKSAVSTLLSPIKIVLMGPLFPALKILHGDPDTPPPFFIVLFASYWSVLALVLHYFLSKLKSQQTAGRRAGKSTST
jgi:hypothetical protein